MKRILLVIILIMILLSCRNPYQELQNAPVVERDGCQYLLINAYGGWTYVHKGDCKNPVHKK